MPETTHTYVCMWLIEMGSDNSHVRTYIYVCTVIEPIYTHVHMYICSSLIQTIEKHYRKQNTYHNSTHAADVLQCAGYFLKKLQERGVSYINLLPWLLHSYTVESHNSIHHPY